MFLQLWAKYRQAWSLRRSEIFTVTRQVAPLNCAPGAKSAVLDFLVFKVRIVSDLCA